MSKKITNPRNSKKRIADAHALVMKAYAERAEPLTARECLSLLTRLSESFDNGRRAVLAAMHS